MIRVVLWDVDGTLLDFKKSEECGIRSCLEEIGFYGCTDEMLQRYSQINRSYWEALERGELTKKEVLTGRFREFFEEEHISCPDVEAFNISYQKKLGERFFEREDSVALCRKLKNYVRQYVVTNGTVTAQRNKLEHSGLGECMDGVFISDEIGIEKPGKGFFDYAFQVIREQMGELPGSEEMLIVGDSLTSDMRGGNNAGIPNCWYNPEGLPGRRDIPVKYVIKSLWEVEGILRRSGVPVAIEHTGL